MKSIYVGIDPSINSSGVTCVAYDEGTLCDTQFFIIKPDKLTKRESEAEQRNIDKFTYVLYDKKQPANKEDNHEVEYMKSIWAIEVIGYAYDCIRKFITKHIPASAIYKLYVCQEGISYGSSIRTKSVMDLAGINYLLRDMVINRLDPDYYIIATPAEIKKKTSGMGNCKKEVMVNLFKAVFPDFDLPKLDDIADSYWMAMYIKHLMETE